MDRAPVPVLHHIGTAGEIGVSIEPELSVVWRVLESRGPIGSLRIGLGDEVIGVLQRTGEVAVFGLRPSIHVVLRAVIDVVGGDIERLGDLKFIYVAVHGPGKIRGDKLVRPAVLPHQSGLPGQIIRDSHLLPARPLQLVTGALGAVAAWAFRSSY